MAGRARNRDRDELIRRLREEDGLSWDEIALGLGMRAKSAKTAYERLRAPSRRRIPEPTRADDERIIDVLVRKEAGWTSSEIAADLGITRAAVCGIIKRVKDDCAEHGFDPLSKGENHEP